MDLTVNSTTFGQGNQTWLGSRHGTQSCRTVTIAKASLTANTHYPNGYIPSGTPLAKATSGTYSGLYVPLAASVSEVQTVTEGGSGLTSFTLTLDGETTGSIAAAATAAAVQSALEALSNIAPGDVTVTGSAGGPYTLTFGGARVGKDVPALTATPTGGSGTVTIATPTAGGSGTTDSSDVLAGFVFVDTPVGAGNPVAALVDHGRIVEANLPLPVNAAAKASAAGRIWFV